MRKSISIVTAMIIMLLVCTGNSRAQMTDLERGNWLLGVVFKLQGMRDDALADIQRYETGIRKANDIISRSEKIVSLARQKGNAEAERIAGNALTKARDARQKNEELRRQAGVLVEITGKNFGEKPEKWQEWWERNKAEEFKRFEIDNGYFSCNIPKDWDFTKTDEKQAKRGVYGLELLGPRADDAPTLVRITFYLKDNKY